MFPLHAAASRSLLRANAAAAEQNSGKGNGGSAQKMRDSLYARLSRISSIQEYVYTFGGNEEHG